jgi:hypothetical protein
VDQRGFHRPSSGGQGDLGAYQNQYTKVALSISSGAFSPSAGTNVSVTATVTSFGMPVTHGQVVISVGGLNFTGTVSTAGTTSVTFTLPPSFLPGSYTLTASYSDVATVNNPTLIYSPSAATGAVTVPTVPTHVTGLNATTQYTLFTSFFDLFSQIDTLSAHVTDDFGNPVNGGTITFVDHGVSVQANVVNGVATAMVHFSLFPTLNAGDPSAHPFTAMFNGTSFFNTSTTGGTVPDSMLAFFFDFFFLVSIFSG